MHDESPLPLLDQNTEPPGISVTDTKALLIPGAFNWDEEEEGDTSTEPLGLTEQSQTVSFPNFFQVFKLRIIYLQDVSQPTVEVPLMRQDTELSEDFDIATLYSYLSPNVGQEPRRPKRSGLRSATYLIIVSEARITL